MYFCSAHCSCHAKNVVNSSCNNLSVATTVVGSWKEPQQVVVWIYTQWFVSYAYRKHVACNKVVPSKSAPGVLLEKCYYVIGAYYFIISHLYCICKCYQGDSGGPFVCNEGGKYVLTGVVSWGQGMCNTNHYTVFARVSSFIQWINTKMSGNLRRLMCLL